jgi:hypothetical protein
MNGILKILLIITCIALFAGFLVAIVIPKAVCATHRSSANGCINNLRQVSAAKEQWRLENDKKEGDVASEADLTPYIKLDSAGHFPKCPGGGTYDIGRIGEDPKCSISTSAWPNSHVLNDTNRGWWFDFKAAYGVLLGPRPVR